MTVQNALLKKQVEMAGRGDKTRELEQEVEELNEVIERLTAEVAELQLNRDDKGKKSNEAALRAQVEELGQALGMIVARSSSPDLSLLTFFSKDEMEDEIESKQRTIKDLEARLRSGGGGGGGDGELAKKLEVMDGVLVDLEQELDASKEEVARLTRENAELRRRNTKTGKGGDTAQLQSENRMLTEELEVKVFGLFLSSLSNAHNVHKIAREEAAKYKQKLDLLRVEYKKLSRTK